MTKGFTFNGQHCSSFGIGMLSKNRMILPAFSDQFENITGRSGSYLFPGDLQDRTIEVDCYIPESTLANLRSKARDVAAWLAVSSRAQLIFDDEDDKFYLARLANQVDLQQLFALGEFPLHFRCDPYAYAVTETDQTIFGSATVTNAGNQPVSPLLICTMTGAVSNLTITNDTGESLVIPGTLATGQVVEIDGGYLTIKTCKIDGGNGLSRMSGSFINLDPGTNSIVISNSNASVRMKFRGKWL